MMASISVSRYSAPIGRILAACRNERIVRIALPSESDASVYKWLQHQFPQDTIESRGVSVLEGLFRQLSDYFIKRLQKFDLVLEFWGTDFQACVDGAAGYSLRPGHQLRGAGPQTGKTSRGIPCRWKRQWGQSIADRRPMPSSDWAKR